MRALEGITVLALEHAVAAPLCTRHLADLGADVIKIERPGEGDFARGYDHAVKGISSFVVWLNRGKRSVTLDIKQPAGREVLDRLVARADVLVQNLAPGATKRLGLDYAALRQRHPNLILCDISGYGEGGPFERKKAYDLLIQAESGLISVTGSANEPSRVGISAADIATGMYANQGVLAALFRRARTGEGAHVSVAMLDALAEWMAYPMYRAAYEGKPPPRVALSHPSVAPYGAHRTQDGAVFFGLQNEREWAVFCTRVVNRPDWIADPRYANNAARAEHRTELTAEIEAFFADKTALQVATMLEEAGIANGRVNDAHAVWRHEQLEGRDRWREIGSGVGPVRALLPPVTFEDVEAAMGAVPDLGQHTDEVLGELGYAPADVAALRVAGAV
jgi:crotonobetainyl-CoA:carnitine CoA-transferase CaiB-like acyl-CoA transferase